MSASQGHVYTTMNGSTKTMPSTTFAPRPSTNVPPATQTFEPLAKSILSHRLFYNIFAYSAAFSLASTVFLAGGDDASFLLRLFQPSTWINASLTWLLGVLPIIVARKVFLTPTPEPTTSPSKTVATAFAKPTTRRSIAIYITSSLLLLSLDFVRTWSNSEDIRLSIFIKSRKHPYYLNGRFIFFVFAQVWLSISFALRDIMLERFVFRWAKALPSSSAPFLPRNLAMLLLTSTLFTFASFAVYNIAFGLARLALLPLLLRIPLLRSLLRPFFGHFIRGPWTLTLPLRYLSLESHAFTLALSMFANWEFAESLFDVYIPQPIKVASATADPNVTLVSGITSTNPLYLHFAYAELRDAALDDRPANASRRTALFSDQKFSPSVWSTLARESLLRLGHDYQTFLRRGATPPADVPVLPAPPKAVKPPSTPLLRRAIFKAQEQSPIAKVLGTFASDSDLSKATDAVASDLGARIVEAPIPELFRSTSSLPAAATTPATTTAGATTPQQNLIGTYVSRATARCRGLVVKYTPLWCREVIAQWDAWWSRDRINKVTEKCLPNRDLDALIVEVLAGLVCASLTEDRYGVVQRDIPRIVEAFLSFLTALEEYHAEVTKLYIPPTPDEITQEDFKILMEKERTRVEVAKATEAIGIVADADAPFLRLALKSGVADIARTFGEKLVAFKFPPRIAKKLQSFVDYA
ncbi:nucleoporin protein Ndc1-Nup [Boletus reticuloceps]|uniref:Nucleoporin protein Ndc1-Nup n=1 Tax=Boletus reticuloceps TaxID=495285 RepID=A0A8I2YC84_9AGAM|nr:nucleoporin protein Ndc1-Nup [Boletus reticuloceps]